MHVSTIWRTLLKTVRLRLNGELNLNIKEYSMKIREQMIINFLGLSVLLTLIALGETGCTTVRHSSDPAWEYPQ